MNLELKVLEKTQGTLVTNIDELEKFVEERIKDYDPSLYQGDADSAKKDRAELNNAVVKLATVRKELIAELMKPYADVEARLKALEKNIEKASKLLDEIVKAKENDEKHLKKIRCLELWNSFNFSLFPMDKVFQKSWLNKTKKESDIKAEMQVIIDRTYKDLKMIERFVEDAETLKARYLENLDIELTLGLAEEMQKNRQRIAEEKATRESRENAEKVEVQKEELRHEVIAKSAEDEMADLVNSALGIEVIEEEKPISAMRKTYVISVSVTDDELLELKRTILNMGIGINTVQEATF